MEQIESDNMNAHYVDEIETVLLKQIGEKLVENELSIGTAESCTGGRIASMLASLPECSDHFIGGIVSYSEDIKKKILEVSANDIDRYGVVSQPVVEEMAWGACRALECTCAIATSGYAGPEGGSPENPVGTVWIATVIQGKVYSARFVFEGDRQEVVQQASWQAFQMLLEMLNKEALQKKELSVEIESAIS